MKEQTASPWSPALADDRGSARPLRLNSQMTAGMSLSPSGGLTTKRSLGEARLRSLAVSRRSRPRQPVPRLSRVDAPAETVFDQIEQGRPGDGLVICHGPPIRSTARFSIRRSDFDRHFAVNARAAWLLIREFGRRFAGPKPHGRIVGIQRPHGPIHRTEQAKGRWIGSCWPRPRNLTRWGSRPTRQPGAHRHRLDVRGSKIRVWSSDTRRSNQPGDCARLVDSCVRPKASCFTAIGGLK